MNILKNIAVSVLGFFLFLALSLFGIAFSLESTVLNPDFVTKQINRLDVSALIRDSLVIEPSSETESEVVDMVYSALDNLEPVVKERLDDTIHAVYEYFPGDSASIDLSLILRQHFFTDELAGDIIDNVDVAGLAGMMIEQQDRTRQGGRAWNSKSICSRTSLVRTLPSLHQNRASARPGWTHTSSEPESGIELYLTVFVILSTV